MRNIKLFRRERVVTIFTREVIVFCATIPIEEVLIGVIIKGVGVIVSGEALVGGGGVDLVDGLKLVLEKTGIGRWFEMGAVAGGKVENE